MIVELDGSIINDKEIVFSKFILPEDGSREIECIVTIRPTGFIKSSIIFFDRNDYATSVTHYSFNKQIECFECCHSEIMRETIFCANLRYYLARYIKFHWSAGTNPLRHFCIPGDIIFLNVMLDKAFQQAGEDIL